MNKTLLMAALATALTASAAAYAEQHDAPAGDKNGCKKTEDGKNACDKNTCKKDAEGKEKNGCEKNSCKK